MSKLNEIFGIIEDDMEIRSVEEFALDLQIYIQVSMKKLSINNKELAKRLGCSPSRISQYLSDGGSNMTAKTIARIMLALGKKISIKEIDESANIHDIVLEISHIASNNNRKLHDDFCKSSSFGNQREPILLVA